MTHDEHSPTDVAMAATVRAADQEAFARIAARHLRELHVHCYRMVGSFDDAEDLVQEALMRAWQSRDSYAGRSTVRAWLYRIATNVCLDSLRRTNAAVHGKERSDMSQYARFPWMQPYPDALLDALVAEDAPPDAQAVSRETIELAFLAAVQSLPAKQRATLILRDVLDFSAAETAAILDDTTAAVNSALQRARVTMERRRESSRRVVATAAATFDEAMLLQVFVDAQNRGDINAIVDLLRSDVRMTLLPDAAVWDGREEVARELRRKRIDFDGDVRSIPIAANRQPAVAVYLRRRDAADFLAWAVIVLGIRAGEVYEIATFASPRLFARFNLPARLSQ